MRVCTSVSKSIDVAPVIPSAPSWPGLTRPSTTLLRQRSCALVSTSQDVDARDKPGHDELRERARLAEYLTVIPGRRVAASPESITTIVSMDSGPAPRGRIPE
ncbi:MAG: hypothetical protein DI543_04655 [Bradyrhizobium icense]|nr:MAG: hypothetical protein DI543_04655 [Bradyrhizobium icense]